MFVIISVDIEWNVAVHKDITVIKLLENHKKLVMISFRVQWDVDDHAVFQRTSRIWWKTVPRLNCTGWCRLDRGLFPCSCTNRWRRKPGRKFHRRRTACWTPLAQRTISGPFRWILDTYQNDLFQKQPWPWIKSLQNIITLWYRHAVED